MPHKFLIYTGTGVYNYIYFFYKTRRGIDNIFAFFTTNPLLNKLELNTK